MLPEFSHLFDHLPLIPERVLKQHAVHQPFDTRFRAAARLLQALWREDRQLPIGSYINGRDKKVRLGSRISIAAAQAGGNFFTADIAALAAREVCYREMGAMIDEERLFTNLLSSMPLCFNLFAPLKLDLHQAASVWCKLIPGLDATVTQVIFEHSPSRSNPRFTDDRTAFDILFRYKTATGRRGFIAVELKYSEACVEPVPAPKARYDVLARETGLFRDPDAAALRRNPLQQLWREHCLAQAMIAEGVYDEGHFILIAPRLNSQVQTAALSYVEQLVEPEGALVRFQNVHLEAILEAIAGSGGVEHAEALHRRYCDFWLVDGEIELALSAIPFGRANTLVEARFTSTDDSIVLPVERPRPRRKRSAATAV